MTLVFFCIPAQEKAYRLELFQVTPNSPLKKAEIEKYTQHLLFGFITVIHLQKQTAQGWTFDIGFRELKEITDYLLFNSPCQTSYLNQFHPFSPLPPLSKLRRREIRIARKILALTASLPQLPCKQI